jgi:hypothetical protein
LPVLDTIHRVDFLRNVALTGRFNTGALRHPRVLVPSSEDDVRDFSVEL